jgi:hypothetical protein
MMVATPSTTKKTISTNVINQSINIPTFFS